MACFSEDSQPKHSSSIILLLTMLQSDHGFLFVSQIYKCDGPECERPGCYRACSSGTADTFPCACGGKFQLVRSVQWHMSLVSATKQIHLELLWPWSCVPYSGLQYILACLNLLPNANLAPPPRNFFREYSHCSLHESLILTLWYGPG